jgi:hypothetical protein
MTSFETERPIAKRDFIIGLLTSMAVRGVTHITTQQGAHQANFRRVIDALDDPTVTGPLSRDRLPTMHPEPISGYVPAFDEALITLQDVGLTRCVGPYFHAVELDIPGPRAERILERFTEDERELLGRLATIYLEDTH